MRIFKKHALLGEAVDVWGLGVRVTIEAADPVIQVINSDEKHIWFSGCRQGRGVDAGNH